MQAKDKPAKADKGRPEKHVAIHAAKPGKGEGSPVSLETKNVHKSAKSAKPPLGGKKDGPPSSSTGKKVVLTVAKDVAKKKPVKIEGAATVSRSRSSKVAAKDKEKSPQESSHSVSRICITSISLVPEFAFIRPGLEDTPGFMDEPACVCRLQPVGSAKVKVKDGKERVLMTPRSFPVPIEKKLSRSRYMAFSYNSKFSVFC